MAKLKTFDFGITWSSPDDSFFARILKRKFRDLGISFLWMDDFNNKSFLRDLLKNKIRIKVLMDTEATYDNPEDIYAKISYAVKDSGGFVFNDPDITQLTIDKAYMYHRLVNAGITVPYTKMLRKWIPLNYNLTANTVRKLGVPFIIKPAHGYAQKGVIRNATGSSYQIRKARKAYMSDTFLLQQKIKPIYFDGKKAWFRILKVFDKLFPCWWDDVTNRYERLTLRDIKKYKLFPLLEITRKIADLTKMTWFSTEIAVINDGGSLEFFSIDPVNDQCDLTPKSEEPNGLPDKLVLTISDCVIRNVRKLLRM